MVHGTLYGLALAEHTTFEFVTFWKSHLVFLRIVRRLLVMISLVPSSPILVTLMKKALGSSETSILKSHAIL
jgi:hypothetical protein